MALMELFNLIWWAVTLLPRGLLGISVIIGHFPTFFAGIILLGVISLTTYMIPVAIQTFVHKDQDLKRKYKAEWALVTGASSGIGRGIVDKLVEQKLNVVLVALDDDLLDKTYNDLVVDNEDLKFIKVGVDLSKGDYLSTINEATFSIDVQLIFNNAGFIMTGFFADNSLEQNMSMYECNATSAMKISHLFLNRLMEAKLPGLISFTSSSAAFIPNPLGSLYASTKSFLTSFASSLAAEVKDFGIDVVVVHPSPMNTRFFENAGQMKTMTFFKKFASSPSIIADVIFQSAGRWVIRDQGAISVLLRILMKYIDYVFITEIITRVAATSADYRTFWEKSKFNQSKTNSLKKD